MPQETKHNVPLQSHHVQGDAIAAADSQALRQALDEALDYRGDVTITLKDGRTIEGYIFDRRTAPTLEGSLVRIVPASSTSPNGAERASVRYDEIATLVFSGKDTAAGKSWENWLRRYAEKKRAGEAANIDAEKLD